MRIVIAAVGRLKTEAERQLVDEYLKRFNGAGRSIGLGQAAVIDTPESRNANADLRKSEEAARLLKLAADSTAIAVLDGGGKALSSEAFASLIGRWRDGGTRTGVFLIGGPDGHGPEALARATIRLSLGPMTLTHGLARVVLAEQLYRAATILAGHPYHRGG